MKTLSKLTEFSSAWTKSPSTSSFSSSLPLGSADPLPGPAPCSPPLEPLSPVDPGPGEEGETALEHAAKAWSLRETVGRVMDAPPGCTLYEYEPIGRNPYVKGKLPAGVRFASPDKRQTNTRWRDWGPSIRSKEKARAEVCDWFQRAKSAGLLPEG